MAEMPLRNVIL